MAAAIVRGGVHAVLRNRCVSTVSAARHFSSVGNDVYDVVVVGAGVVGSTLACKLASTPSFAGRRVALVDPRKPTAVPLTKEDPVDLRVFAITPASSATFQALDVWSDMEGARAGQFNNVQVWDASGSGHLVFDSSMTGSDVLGNIVENRVLQETLFSKLLELQDAGRVHLMCPDSIKSLQVSQSSAPGLADVELGSGTQLQAQLVVAADGANSKVRSLCHVGAWGWDYDQRGVVCTIRTDVPHTTAWQRFLPTGPVAMLPLWDGLSSIVWSTNPRHAAALQALSDEEFVAALNGAFNAPADSDDTPPILRPVRDMAAHLSRSIASSTTGGPHRLRPPPHVTSLAGPRASFPLRFSSANKYTDTRVAFIGDAAHTVHPLAGQGLNLGIADATKLGDALVRASEAGADLGAAHVLRQYEEASKRHNVAMGLGMDTVKNMFSGGPGLWADVRNIGLAVLNKASPVKAGLARVAAGQASAAAPFEAVHHLADTVVSTAQSGVEAIVGVLSGAASGGRGRGGRGGGGGRGSGAGARGAGPRSPPQPNPTPNPSESTSESVER